MPCGDLIREYAIDIYYFYGYRYIYFIVGGDYRSMSSAAGYIIRVIPRGEGVLLCRSTL